MRRIAASSILDSFEEDPLANQADPWLRQALRLPEGAGPFPWQERLLGQFTDGTIERSLDIPTGLGKTAVMAIWLVARACGAPLPRRLVYVVDRRAVVDQATEVAEGLRTWVGSNAEVRAALGLADRSLPISTLRGQHVDNREWLADPALPAIIIGTVDMIGSRLLFEGYGTSRKMRPYHAGLLGVDSLVVLDEAHLVPPFEKLLETIAGGSETFGPRDEALRRIIPPFKLMSLSATGRNLASKSVGLLEADLEHPELKKRLNAKKRLQIFPLGSRKMPEALAEEAWKLSGNGTCAVRCIVFCDKRKDAEAAKAAIEKLAQKAAISLDEVDRELFVGGRRVFEREDAAQRLKVLGFIAGTKIERSRPVFLFATSAGEVGVDLDADHMVADLVAWERMVQRLGRVNRRGDGEADVIVIADSKPPKALNKPPKDYTNKEAKEVEAYKLLDATRQALTGLPRTNGRHDVSSASLAADLYDTSPGSLYDLKRRAEIDPELKAVLDAATTPTPLRPALSRALVDAWSMTSLKEHTGRPEIDPWLRGWVEDKPQTTVVWRRHLPVRKQGNTATKKEIEEFFEATPPHASEKLETETSRVVEWLVARGNDCTKIFSDAKPASPDDVDSVDVVESAPFHSGEVVAVVLSSSGDLRQTLTLEELNPDDDGDLTRTLAGATVVVDARVAGLTEKDGLLDKKASLPPLTADDYEQWTVAGAAGTGGARPAPPDVTPMVRFRVRIAEAGQLLEAKSGWRERFRFATHKSAAGEGQRWLIVEKWRHAAATEDDRSIGRPQLLDEHSGWVEDRVRKLALALRLPKEYVEMLATAARLHDEGKRVERWQRAFKANSDGIYAKTASSPRLSVLDHYRHEFGSLLVAQNDAELRNLSEDLRELALHLVAAHHGFARPMIGTNGCEAAPPSLLEGDARDVALRFARLQKRWGPWGLAWWESLLRAADQQASRDNDSQGSNPTSGPVSDPAKETD